MFSFKSSSSYTLDIDQFLIKFEVGVQFHSPTSIRYPVEPASFARETILSPLNVLAPLSKLNCL